MTWYVVEQIGRRETIHDKQPDGNYAEAQQKADELRKANTNLDAKFVVRFVGTYRTGRDSSGRAVAS